ncbi:MBOAT-like protein 5 [Elsinoe fawcettii]|nr:MBOAT-like protein 5 [Elsinoe fawcettii]
MSLESITPLFSPIARPSQATDNGMSTSEFLTHPFHALEAEIAIIALVLGFTAANSVLRYAAFPVVGGLSWFICSTAVLENRLRTPWGTLSGGISFVFVLQYVATVLLGRRHFDDTRDSSKPLSSHGTDTLFYRLLYGISTTCSLRAIGTPYQCKNVPPITRSPSRPRFLARCLTICIAAYLFLDAASLSAHPELNSTNFAQHKIAFLRRLGLINSEELFIRTTTILGVWVSLYIYLQMIYYGMALVAVGSGITSVAAWPPLYGSWSDAWSVRQFWGVFWHQALRIPLSAMGGFLTTTIGLRKGSLASRYVQLFLTFYVSGLLHIVADLARGISWKDSGAISFFCTQAFGIMAEDAVQALLARGATQKEGRVGRKVFGYIWTALFLIWSTPMWQYPSLSVDSGTPEDALLPFSPLLLVLKL